ERGGGQDGRGWREAVGGGIYRVCVGTRPDGARLSHAPGPPGEEEGPPQWLNHRPDRPWRAANVGTSALRGGGRVLASFAARSLLRRLFKSFAQSGAQIEGRQAV